MKKKSLFLVLLSIFLLCLGACGQKESQSGKGMKIVTSFYLRQMTSRPSMMQMSLFTIRIRLNLGQEVWIPI